MKRIEDVKKLKVGDYVKASGTDMNYWKYTYFQIKKITKFERNLIHLHSDLWIDILYNGKIVISNANVNINLVDNAKDWLISKDTFERKLQEAKILNGLMKMKA